VRLGQVIRKLKQLWPAGCVTAALLHGNPRLGQGLEGEAAPLSPSDAAAAAAAEEPLDGEPDVVATQLRRVPGVEGFAEGLQGFCILGIPCLPIGPRHKGHPDIGGVAFLV
jgi:hypothetical protein